MVNESINVRIPESIKVAFKAITEFNIPSQDDVIFRECFNTNINIESRSENPLLLNKKGLTSGMLSSCVDPTLIYLDKFYKLSDEFDVSISPYLPKIEALRENQNQIKELENESEQAQINIENTHGSNQKYNQAKIKYEQLKQNYTQMYNAEGQREAKNFSPLLYGLILILIGAVEWLINYSSFLEFYNVPAMAAGFTFAVSLAVACASHWHGSRLKGSSYFFGDHVEISEKNKEILAISFATAALLIAICYVGWVRYSWAIDLLSQLGTSNTSIDQDTTLPTIDVGNKVVVSLIANLLVWFIGAAFAYAVHDKNPRFTEKLREYNRANKEFLNLHKPIELEIHQQRSKLAQNIYELKNIATAISEEAAPLAEIKTIKDQRVLKVNSQINSLVNALIRNYQSSLSSIAIVENPTLQFNANGTLINLENYRQIQIKFSFVEDIEEEL